jgi:hypothetical protein
MEAIHINMMAVLVAVVANFILGFIWYTPLFVKTRARELGLDLTIKPTGGQMARGMIFMVIGNFFMAYVFAHNMAAWSFVPGSDQMSPMANIMSATVFTWLGFFLPSDLSTVAWERRSWKLFGINTTYHFLTLLVAALIIYNMS